MKTAITILLLLASLPSIASAHDDTYGLGDGGSQSVLVSSTVETFGLAPAASSEMICPNGMCPMPVAIVSPYSSPRGYHRHVMTDGSIIEHHDSNYGDPVAHRGVAGRGWPKYFGTAAPGRTVTRSRTVATDCPTCPGGVAYSVQSYSDPVGVTVKRTSVRRSAWRPFRNMVNAFAQRRFAVRAWRGW